MYILKTSIYCFHIIKLNNVILENLERNNKREESTNLNVLVYFSFYINGYI